MDRSRTQLLMALRTAALRFPNLRIMQIIQQAASVRNLDLNHVSDGSLADAIFGFIAQAKDYDQH